MKFSQDDRVQYVGSKFAELHGKMGWVIAEVDRDPGKYVVEFDGLKDPDYIMPATSLAPWNDAAAFKKDEKANDKMCGIEIRRNRKRTAEEEV